mmetsp:Transcript_56280/g.98767  ORF Transcript_56280/g.98767 Transcript_56280/m.98767 type:complete len:312 (-) Transcript_56280:412-1347(-)
MTHRLLHLQIHQKFLVVIVRTLSETVVAAQAMDVAGERGEVSACEEGRAGAHDALDHADRVGIHVAQHTLALKVTQKANFPAGLDKRLPTRIFGAARRLGRRVGIAGFSLHQAVFAEPIRVVGGDVHHRPDGNHCSAVGVMQIVHNFLRTDLHVLELEIASADVQCVIVTVKVGRHRAGLLAHRLHQPVAGTLDLIFVPHEVTHKPSVERLHGVVREERKSIMMLQQPVLRIGGKVHVVRLLQCLVVKHWTAVSTKGLHALLQGLVGLDVSLGELKVASSLGRKSDIFACPNRPHVGYLFQIMPQTRAPGF